jgi:hypothetical protein
MRRIVASTLPFWRAGGIVLSRQHPPYPECVPFQTNTRDNLFLSVQSAKPLLPLARALFQSIALEGFDVVMESRPKVLEIIPCHVKELKLRRPWVA